MLQTVILASLCFSGAIFAISVMTPTKEETDWPMAILAHLFWPITIALILREIRRERRAEARWE